MASLLSLSKRQPDLLSNGNDGVEPVFEQRPEALKMDLEAPKNVGNDVPHPLLAEGSRMNPSVGDYVNAQRMLAGNPYAEKMIMELNAASQINRGPEGVFQSSRIHWDLLLGRDESIFPSDYLNYDSFVKY